MTEEFIWVHYVFKCWKITLMVKNKNNLNTEPLQGGGHGMKREKQQQQKKKQSLDTAGKRHPYKSKAGDEA